jgi:hypothetical protein
VIWESEFFFSLILVNLVYNNNNRVKTAVQMLSIWFIHIEKGGKGGKQPVRNRT